MYNAVKGYAQVAQGIINCVKITFFPRSASASPNSISVGGPIIHTCHDWVHFWISTHYDISNIEINCTCLKIPVIQQIPSWGRGQTTTIVQVWLMQNN